MHSGVEDHFACHFFNLRETKIFMNDLSRWKIYYMNEYMWSADIWHTCKDNRGAHLSLCARQQDTTEEDNRHKLAGAEQELTASFCCRDAIRCSANITVGHHRGMISVSGYGLEAACRPLQGLATLHIDAEIACWRSFTFLQRVF